MEMFGNGLGDRRGLGVFLGTDEYSGFMTIPFTGEGFIET